MQVKTARKVSVFNRLEGGQSVKNKVCVYWLSGRCNRNPCRFMHRESPPPQDKQTGAETPEHGHYLQSSRTWRNLNHHASKNGTDLANRGVSTKVPNDEAGKQKVLVNNGRKSDSNDKERVITSNESICSKQLVEKASTVESESKPVQMPQPKLCNYWVTGNCVHGDKCKDVHSWFWGSGFTMLTKLEGHVKAVTGIALPLSSDKLYSVSKDRTIRIWDCNSGQCIGSIDLNGEVMYLSSEGPWLFAGLPNAIKAWNFEAQSEHSLSGPAGQVYSLAMAGDMLYAGIEDGTILAWKCCPATSVPEIVALMKGHNGAVRSLVVGANMLYSGSSDNTIRVWDLRTLQCMQTLHGHTRDVTSVICWDRYLLSASLDNTLKVWAATESGDLDVVYELKEACGVVALCGMTDAEARPILFCSYNDNTVRLYDLPSFNERGRLFSKGDVQVIQIGIDGLFFTGDTSGQISVWKLH